MTMFDRLQFHIIKDKMFSPSSSGFRVFALAFLVFVLAGASARTPKRIIGGSDAKPGEIPWQVSVRVDGTHICGGSIVGDSHILTAAHCIAGISEYSRITVVTGSNTLEPGFGQAYDVKDAKIHERYVERTTFTTSQNDIAVISLKTKIEENEYQKVIGLPSGNVPSGVEGIVSGFGEINRNGQSSRTLQKLTVFVLGKSQCAESGIYIERYQMCGVKATNSGTCEGDGGSPLVYNGTVVGVVSTSPIKCGVGIPDVYTRVDYYKDFVRSVVAQN